MTKQVSYWLAAAAATLGVIMWAPVHGAQANESEQLSPASTPVVFQAAGPNAATIQSAVDQFRAALGGINNGNEVGPLPTGRREINWDGGGNNPATSPGPTPFQVFLVTRGADITTPGTGFVQATPAGLGDTFGNPSLATVFQAFSPLRLFAPIGSRTTRVDFFVPGGGNIPADTSAFGVVLSDVDTEDTTRIKFFDAEGALLHEASAPASPGVGTFSFVGVGFTDVRIASVRIVTGNHRLEAQEQRRRDLVVMDDFIYGEPQPRP